MIFDILGWIGTFLLVMDYILLSTNKIENGKLYQIINLVASLCMAIGVFPKNAWFSFALQVVWGIIAIVALIKIKDKKEEN